MNTSTQPAPHFVPHLSELRHSLERHRPIFIADVPGVKRAAVAAIVREHPESGAELLFIHRAEHPRDPWSGHMAFPGGRKDDGDVDTRDTALRETREEIGLDLGAAAEPLAELSHLNAIAHGKRLPMVIVPYLYELVGDPQLALNHEVQSVHWVPLTFLLDPHNRGTLERKVFGQTLDLPCYEFDGQTIWGLTLRMADELLELLG